MVRWADSFSSTGQSRRFVGEKTAKKQPVPVHSTVLDKKNYRMFGTPILVVEQAVHRGHECLREGTEGIRQPHQHFRTGQCRAAKAHWLPSVGVQGTAYHISIGCAFE